MFLARQCIRREKDFLLPLTYIFCSYQILKLLFLHSKSTMKRILPSLPFLPVGLNDAVKILFYYKSFHWMTPWHYRTLERKKCLHCRPRKNIFLYLFNKYLRAYYVPHPVLGAEDKSSQVWKLSISATFSVVFTYIYNRTRIVRDSVSSTIANIIITTHLNSYMKQNNVYYYRYTVWYF